jgi:hypothetical protein
MSDDHKIDNRPPKRTRRKKGPRGNAGRKSQRPRRLIEIIDDVLLMPITVVEDGLVRQVPAVEAILLQLLRKELSGSRRALVVRLGYQRMAREHAERTLAIRFVDGEYTQALSRGQSSAEAENDQV